MKKRKLLPVLLLTLGLLNVSAQTSFTTNVDDYTNNKNGKTSKAYTFTIGSTAKNALGKDYSNTNMTWGEWLNINHDGFNTDGYYQVTTSGGSSSAQTAYKISYGVGSATGLTTACSNLTKPNDDFVYANNTVTPPTDLSCTGYTFNGWYNGNTKLTSSIKATADVTYTGSWTANEIKLEAKTIVLDWDAEDGDSYKKIAFINAATNGTGNYTYSITSGNSNDYFSINGITITLNQNAPAGKYSLTVKAVDNNSKKEKTATITVYVKPVLTNKTYQINYGEHYIYLKFSNFNELGSFTFHSEKGSLDTFSTMYLNSLITSETEIEFSLKIEEQSFNYKIKVTSDSMITLFIDDAFTTYNAKEQKPSFFVGSYNGKKQEDLFTWDPENKTDVGTHEITATVKSGVFDGATLQISGDNGASSSKKIDFVINPFELTSDNTTIQITSPGNSVTYNGDQDVKLDVKANLSSAGGDSSVSLTQDKDYTINITKVSDVKEYAISITGKGNYSETVSVGTIKVTQKTVNDTEFSYTYTNEWSYTGSEIKPPVIIKWGEKYLAEGTDYDVTYSNNTNVGTGKIEITYKGNYSGSKELSFTINANNLSISTVNGYGTYNSSAQDGGGKVVVNNTTNATVKYSTAKGNYSTTKPTFTNAGTYTVYCQVSATGFNTIEGDNCSYQVVIAKANSSITLDKSEITITMPNTGTVNVKNITNGLSYTVAVKDTNVVTASTSGNTITLTPKSAGETTMTVSTNGNNNYNQASAVVNISVKLGTLTVTPTSYSGIYDGQGHSISLALNPNDANVTYSYQSTDGENPSSTTNPTFTNAGTYVVAYTVSKQYYESVYGTAAVVIKPKTLTTVELSNEAHTYNGKQQTVETITVKDGTTVLKEGTYYTVAYSNNISPGTATVTITGIGNYTGTISKTFTISKGTFEFTPEASDVTCEYTGYETDCGAEVKITNNNNIAYNLAYSNSSPTCPSGVTCTNDNKEYNGKKTFKDVGEHTLYWAIKSDGYQTKTGTIKVTITKKKLAEPEVFGSYIYTGLTQSPTWLNYNSNFVEMSGKTEAKDAGTYNVFFKLKDTKNTTWTDGTIANKTKTWTIQSISVKDHETVVENDIAYNEIKQLFVSNGRTTFDRTGYTQIAWVESCDDDKELVQGLSKRTCDYSKYTMVKDRLLTTTDKDGNTVAISDEATCVNKSGVWDAETKSCLSPRLNYYETSSSFSGMYVADYLNYDTTKSYDLYAVWSKVTYRIEYDLCDSNGCGEDKNNNPTFASYDSTVNITNPTRTGYKFVGWEVTGMDETPHEINGVTITDKTYTIPKEWVIANNSIPVRNLTSIPDSTVKLTAKWEPIVYTITYHLNNQSYKDDDNQVTKAYTSGGTEVNGERIFTQKFTYDVPANLAKNPFTLAGYTYKGWSTVADNQIKSVTKDLESVSTDNNDKNCTTYTNKLDANKLSYVDGDKILSDNGCLIFADQQNVVNLSSVDNKNIDLYAEWERLDGINFTVTYWKQDIGANTYTNAGVEYYTGTADTSITLTPYTYAISKNKSENQNSRYVNTSDADKTKHTKENGGITVGEKKNSSYHTSLTPTYVSGASALQNDYFRGFTSQENAKDYYNQASTNNKAYTFILSPNGDLNINVYYTRNTYTVTYYMDGGTVSDTASSGKSVITNSNGNATQTRQYQVEITFKNPGSNSSLKAGTGDVEGGRNNAGTGDFAGWVSSNSITNTRIYGIDGEVTTDSNVWAKWLQFSYSGNNGNENSWTSWQAKQKE